MGLVQRLLGIATKKIPRNVTAGFIIRCVTTDDGTTSNGKEYEAFGNFNYGAAGAALGIDRTTLLRGAGFAQARAGTSRPQWGHWWSDSPYGDEPTDQYWIEYYENVYGK